MFVSIPHMLEATIREYPDNLALKMKKGDQFVEYTYRKMGQTIRRLARALDALGLKSGDKIAILSNNRPEWTITDFAVLVLRGVVVPIYQTLPPNQIAYLLHDSETRAIFVENEEQYQKILAIKAHLPQLQFIFSIDPLPQPPDIMDFEQLCRRGQQFGQVDPEQYNHWLAAIQPDDICSLVYTSGTTGAPKGVMLHHRGFITDILEAEAVLNLRPDDVFLSFLPLSHLYERLAGHWCPMLRGASIFYSQGISTVIDDIAIAHPTVIVSVPRLFEKIAAKVLTQVDESSYLKRKIFYWASRTGRRYHDAKYKGRPGAWLAHRYRLADKLVFSKIKAKLGGRLRYPIAGGAPLSVETLKFFEALDTRIIEGYGMTETHLIITLTPYGKTKYGSCGKPIGQVEVRIADDGEVLVKGPTLMAGYYNLPEVTRETIDSDGWLHTGDIGYLDHEGYLFLTDRKKNIIVTSGGKNIPAARVENLLKTSKYIDDVCLIGNQRNFISALIIPNFETLTAWAQQHQLSFHNNPELVDHPAVIGLIAEEIDVLQIELARFEKVKKFILLAEPLSIDRGELTPSLKIRRAVIEQKYKAEIDQLYESVLE